MNNTSWKSLAPFATLAGLIIVVWLDVRGRSPRCAH